MPGPRPKNLPPRSDPTSRRRRGYAGFDPTVLQGRDPSLKYKLVDPADKMNGVSQHEQNGWEVVKLSKDGPKLQMGSSARNAGDPITLYDHVLMCIDRVEWERVEQEGQFGERGQQLADYYDGQISAPQGGSPDGGVHGGSIGTVINETQPAREFEVSTI